jgi:hypothetical protein
MRVEDAGATQEVGTHLVEVHAFWRGGYISFVDADEFDGAACRSWRPAAGRYPAASLAKSAT